MCGRGSSTTGPAGDAADAPGAVLLRRLAVVLVLLTALVPLAVSEGFLFPFVSPKGHLLRVLVDGALVSWAWLAVADRSHRPRQSLILVALVAVVGVVGITDLFGVYPARSLLGNLERMEGWFTTVHLLALMVVASSVLGSERLWGRFAQVSLAASVVVTVTALAQLAGVLPTDSLGGRLEGTLGNPAFLAAYLAFHVWLAVWVAMRPGCTRAMRLAIGVVIVAEGVALYFTATRSAILGVLVGALVAAVLVLRGERRRPLLRRVAAAVAVGVLLVVAAVALLRHSSWMRSAPVMGRFAAISPSELTSRSRLLAWRAALEGAAERPWLGWGQESFGVVYARHYDPRLFDQEPFFDRAHNVFLDWLVAGGVPALAAFGTLLWAFLRAVWRGQVYDPVERSLLTGLGAGYVVHASLLFDTVTSLAAGTAVLAYAHWRATSLREAHGGRESPGRSWQWRLAAGLVTAAAAASVALTAQTVAAERALVRALEPDPRGPEGNLESFRRALRHRTPATPEAREKLAAATVEMARGPATDQATLEQLAELAYREMTQQVRECPLDLRYRLTLAGFLRQLSAFDAAEAQLEEALRLSPCKQQVLFELGSLRLNQGRQAEALESFRTAHLFAPEWDEARNRYAAAALLSGRRDLAERLLVPAEGTVAIADDRVIAALSATGDLANLTVALERRLQTLDGADPRSHQVRTALAAARRALAERVFADGFESGSTRAWLVQESRGAEGR